MNLVRAELLKLRTTSIWWIFALGLFPLWALTLVANWGTSGLARSAVGDSSTSGLQSDQLRAAGRVVNVAANLYTSGQFFGLLVVLLLSAIIVTNEFFQLTATTTFLVTPARERIVAAKTGAAVIVALLLWLALTVLNLIVAPLLLLQLRVGVQLGEPGVWRAIAMNGLAFLLWAVVGVGAGDELPGRPARWVGAVVLIGYALIMGLNGTVITRHRDIS